MHGSGGSEPVFEINVHSRHPVMRVVRRNVEIHQSRGIGMELQDQYSVTLESPTGLVDAQLSLYEDIDNYRVDVASPGYSFSRTADDYFAAFQLLRSDMQKKGLTPLCNGASLDVYPSPMGRDMGGGYKAYKLHPGQQAKMADLINIFEHTIEIRHCTVDEQNEYYEKWLSSL
jgi:hypothetical protein